MAKTWEETRITEKQFKEHCAECTHKCDVYPIICRENLQAKISFEEGEQQGIDKGREEVVEFVEEHMCNLEEWTGWQEMKEEWGISGKPSSKV